MRAGMKVLERGELFGIYPEGTRSHDGRLQGPHRCRPAGAGGQGPGHPVRRGRHRRGRTARQDRRLDGLPTTSGAPLDFSRYEGMEGDRLILREPSPTRSCTRSWSCPARSTSTCTPPRPSNRRAARSPAPEEGPQVGHLIRLPRRRGLPGDRGRTDRYQGEPGANSAMACTDIPGPRAVAQYDVRGRLEAVSSGRAGDDPGRQLDRRPVADIHHLLPESGCTSSASTSCRSTSSCSASRDHDRPSGPSAATCTPRPVPQDHPRARLVDGRRRRHGRRRPRGRRARRPTVASLRRR